MKHHHAEDAAASTVRRAPIIQQRTLRCDANDAVDSKQPALFRMARAMEGHLIIDKRTLEMADKTISIIMGMDDDTTFVAFRKPDMAIHDFVKLDEPFNQVWDRMSVKDSKGGVQ